MVNFRYHIVSLTAVFVALCLGVVLGAGPLQSRISSGLASKATTASSNEALVQAQNNGKIERFSQRGFGCVSDCAGNRFCGC